MSHACDAMRHVARTIDANKWVKMTSRYRLASGDYVIGIRLIEMNKTIHLLIGFDLEIDYWSIKAGYDKVPSDYESPIAALIGGLDPFIGKRGNFGVKSSLH